MSDFHIIVIFNEYYTQIVAVFDETDREQKQTCCKPTIYQSMSESMHYLDHPITYFNYRSGQSFLQIITIVIWFHLINRNRYSISLLYHNFSEERHGSFKL